MSVEFCGLRLAHPVINGSGTFDALAALGAFGRELAGEFPFSAYVSKTITLRPRDGNPSPRLWEAPAGLVNSIGLPNRGLDAYMNDDLPRLSFTARDPSGGEPVRVPVITNVMGPTAGELCELAAACQEREAIDAIELNVSCPNVSTGLDIGSDPQQLEQVVRSVRPCTSKPLIVKLTPNTVDVALCARAAEEGGADAVSLINTLRARPQAPGGAGAWLGGGSGGLSGPAVRLVALAQVAAVAERVAIPVIGMGGVQCARHARELIDVGAALVAIGTETFRDPGTAPRIARELLAGA